MRSVRRVAADSITQALRTGSPPVVLVRTVTGLEQLAAEELAAANHRVIDLSKRQLIVEPTAATIITSPPHLADDLFVVQAAAPDPGRTKQELAAAVTEACAQLNGAGDFAVTASSLGRRTYNRFDIEDLVGGLIQQRSGARYHSRRTGEAPPIDRAEWRVILDGKTLWIGVRPYDVPLHRRVWRRQTVTGSLHPPVAAAMARLARIAPGHRVLDPFCGAGTLLLEAQAVEPAATYVGIDQEPIAVAAAQLNSPRESSIVWRTGDAARLDGPVDRILTNPPWDVRLGIGSFTPYLAQWREVLAPDGLVVAILNHQQAATMIGDAAWRVSDVYDVAVAGQHPRIVVASAR
ncbi:methyltransferase domain-containing protein [Kribbella capetownensis]|uniref:Methyltransferase domain-containing protein n=1 Tax=Kribbella capetownensis TaxID=1572659 RepID=A0A4R0JBQ3_9ACTN|nr:methyltransferase [Kribbella capetownensis]TCC42864.1 methyltransferase domain-containing protein [Kribbella capetownensis]